MGLKLNGRRNRGTRRRPPGRGPGHVGRDTDVDPPIPVVTDEGTNNMQRRLLMAMAVSATVFLVTFVLALAVSYPSWMWIFVAAGLIVPPAVGGVALVLLLRQLWTGRARVT